MNVNRLIRAEILQIKQYHVADSTGMVKLDIMENPYQWPRELTNKWLNSLKQAQINRYPDVNMVNVKSKMLESADLTDNHDVMFGNGSDELIQIIMQSLRSDAGPIMSLSPSFSMFKYIANISAKSFRQIQLDDDFNINLSESIDAIVKYNPSCLFICYPNNPTGNRFDEQVVLQLIKACKGLVVIDEAYQPFAGSSMIKHLHDYQNLLILQTLSKAGFAGLRFGMLFADKIWLNEFNKLKLPFNINSLTQKSIEFVIEHQDYIEQWANLIISERQRVYKTLISINGVTAFQSHANFILFKVENAAEVYNKLIEQKILIKCLHESHGALNNCLRVSIGKPQENDAFLKALAQIIL